jgi:hypothetical protein
MGADHDQYGHHEHEGGMAHGKPKADGLGPLPVGHKFASGVIDGGDMVGVKRVPHAEQIGSGTQSDANYYAPVSSLFT